MKESNVINTVLKVGIYGVPILLGAIFTYSALFRYPKPPVKFHWRVAHGLVGVALLYFGIRVLLDSK